MTLAISLLYKQGIYYCHTYRVNMFYHVFCCTCRSPIISLSMYSLRLKINDSIFY
uniref:Predicted protein n=1 Tax=Hordeum vulgare subsp. vulgare TaxID=112509 RepID=F2EIK8_HORVV|nr:predicted protein [Hordeum vulgare subsp. vulgare]